MDKCIFDNLQDLENFGVCFHTLICVSNHECLLLITIIKAKANLWEQMRFDLRFKPFSEHKANQNKLLDHEYAGCIAPLFSAILGTH